MSIMMCQTYKDLRGIILRMWFVELQGKRCPGT